LITARKPAIAEAPSACAATGLATAISTVDAQIKIRTIICRLVDSPVAPFERDAGRLRQDWKGGDAAGILNACLSRPATQPYMVRRGSLIA
jgi:hypothetical protein